MEKLLYRLRIQDPPLGMRERVMSAVCSEMHSRANKINWVDALWSMRGFWYGIAATVLLCIAAIFLAPGADLSRPRSALPKPSDVALAKEVARSLGDGPTLERTLMARLNGPARGDTHYGMAMGELLRSVQ